MNVSGSTVQRTGSAIKRPFQKKAMRGMQLQLACAARAEGTGPNIYSVTGRAPAWAEPARGSVPRAALQPARVPVPRAMRLRLALCAALVLATETCARRTEQDFEFADADPSDEADAPSAESALTRRGRARRYVYDPHNPLCRALACKKRELCLLRDAFTALCTNKKDVLRKGDVIVSAGGGASASGGGSVSEDDVDDVFYDAGASAPAPSPAPGALAPDRCVGCGGSGVSGGFLCGSDNRTYSSLCRLDLHNCVRRPKPPVALACRGFCPCRAARGPRRRPASSPRRRLRARLEDADRSEWRRRSAEAAHNEVLPARPDRRRLAPGSGCALDKMANRLLDWFSVLMEEAQGAPPPRAAGFPPECKPEVRWMFAHLDTDGDGALSAADLYALRHDERERCLRPFLASCGSGGGGVTRGAWCACLRRAARPCTALARAHGGAGALGGYVPACDERGYYRPRQCHAALGVCWCVDAHGAELPGSRARGEPPCAARASPPAAPARDGAPADDEDGAGSGEAELHF